MNLLIIENMSKSYTERMLFSHINLGINEGDKIGVIGINGTGKSTLLKIIAGLEEPDEGSLTRGKKVRIEYLAQTPSFDDSKTLLENVIHEKKAEEEYRNLEGEAAAMLARLGLPDVSVHPSALSGGQRKRAALVRTLLTPAEILVLDEPTNHLDASMVEWLEDYLNRYQGAFIMVTHDRYFLDRVANKLVELDKGSLYTYQSNYSGFLELKAQREETLAAAEKKNQNRFRIELEWMRRGARARSTKQKAHIRRFEELRDRERPETDGTVEINALSSRLGRKTIEWNNLSKSYEDRRLIRDFSYILLPGDRIGIIGPNGCGKTTLLKLLTGKETPDGGTIETGGTIRIGYFSQENEYMDESLRVIDYIRDTAEYIRTADGTATASQMCERFLFTPSMQYTVIGRLSGGEKRRLYLLKVLMEAPNVLILDEPTNDLDIPTLTVLEDYIGTYDGIVVAVSHDRYFLDKIATRIFAFEEDGQIRQYEGGFTDYKEAVSRAGREAVDSLPVSGSAPKTSGQPHAARRQREARLKFTWQEQKEYETIDADIEALEEQIEQADRQIEASSSDYSALNEWMGKKEALEKDLEAKMERWVYLNDLAERIEEERKARSGQ